MLYSGLSPQRSSSSLWILRPPSLWSSPCLKPLFLIRISHVIALFPGLFRFILCHSVLCWTMAQRNSSVVNFISTHWPKSLLSLSLFFSPMEIRLCLYSQEFDDFFHSFSFFLSFLLVTWSIRWCELPECGQPHHVLLPSPWVSFALKISLPHSCCALQNT